MNTNNRIGTYGYAVFKNKKLNMSLYIVEVYHSLTYGIYVFSNSKDAKDFILDLKSDLILEYNPDFNFTQGIISEYTNNHNLYSSVKNKGLYLSYR